MLDLLERGHRGRTFIVFALALVLAAFAIGACGGDDDGDGDSGARGDTLATVIDRGELKCGVKQTQPLFGFKEADGSVSGFDIEFCKAIAAAVLGDADAVEFIDASDASTRFELLNDEQIDVLIRTTTITASRDRELGVDFAQTTFYTGQAFAVRKDSGISSTADMGDAAICVQSGTTHRAERGRPLHRHRAHLRSAGRAQPGRRRELLRGTLRRADRGLVGPRLAHRGAG